MYVYAYQVKLDLALNPLGRPRSEPRMFGMDQTGRDVIALLEQPVEVTKNKKKRQVPAIIAIYDQIVDFR